MLVLPQATLLHAPKRSAASRFPSFDPFGAGGRSTERRTRHVAAEGRLCGDLGTGSLKHLVCCLMLRSAIVRVIPRGPRLDCGPPSTQYLWRVDGHGPRAQRAVGAIAPENVAHMTPYATKVLPARVLSAASGVVCMSRWATRNACAAQCSLADICCAVLSRVVLADPFERCSQRGSETCVYQNDAAAQPLS